MKLYVVDTEGWVEVHDSMGSIEDSVEVIDINNNEFRVIDNFGYMYEWQVDSDTYSEHKLVRTNRVDSGLLDRINSHNGGAFKI